MAGLTCPGLRGSGSRCGTRSSRSTGSAASRAEEGTMAWSVGAGLEGKGVIVTGAAGGIGRTVAEAFATTGARVMAVDLTQDGVEAVHPPPQLLHPLLHPVQVRDQQRGPRRAHFC